MFWLKKTNRKLRNDERQNTQRDKHTTRQSARVTHPAQLTQLEHRLQPPPAPNRAGRPCYALLYVPQETELDLTRRRRDLAGFLVPSQDLLVKAPRSLEGYTRLTGPTTTHNPPIGLMKAAKVSSGAEGLGAGGISVFSRTPARPRLIRVVIPGRVTAMAFIAASPGCVCAVQCCGAPTATRPTAAPCTPRPHASPLLATLASSL